MSSGDRASPQPSAPRRRVSVRVRAAIAGGLALGLGAGFTLAAWNDAELAKATFTASRFGTQSSVNGGAYADNAAAPGMALTLPVGGYVPNGATYTMVRIRTVAQSVVGTATLGGATFSNNAGGIALSSAMLYRVVRVDTAATCDANAFTAASPNWVVGGATSAALLSSGQNSGVVNPLAAATPSAAGVPTAFCFQVYLAADAPSGTQSQTATATWTFTTRST